jgi:glycosyltransferase involved in cell wall biosynthesis
VTAISVIISTYNRPDFLAYVLHGYSIQSDMDFEIIIADDGSEPSTAELIQLVRESTGMRITHVWHEHRGFRKSIILNRCILAARTEHLLFTDGDCIPKRDLIAVHRQLSQPGKYVSGGYLKLSDEVSKLITIADIDSERITKLSWLRSKGWRPGRRALRLFSPSRFSTMLDAITPTKPDFNGNNTSAWRSSLLEVNGFEGEMGYGGLDQALGIRLQNAGFMGIMARHRAVVMHLHHERPYKKPEMMRANRERILRLRKNGEFRAKLGIFELEPDPTLRIDGQPVFGD